MTGNIARIATLSLALALVAVSVPGDIVEPVTDETDGLAPSAEAHVCVLEPRWNCSGDECDDEPHVHFPRHGPSCVGTFGLAG